jgi:hypothetical protein
MSFDLLEPLARLITTVGAIEGLRDLFAAEEPLDDIVARVAGRPSQRFRMLTPSASLCCRGLMRVPRPQRMGGRWNSISISTHQAGVRALKQRCSERR